MFRSCAYLRTLRVTGPWRSAGDPARRNSAAASRGLRIDVEFGISRLMPTTGLCRPWRGAHPYWSARSANTYLSGHRRDRHVAQTGRFIAPRAQGLTSHSVEGAGRWGLTRWVGRQHPGTGFSATVMCYRKQARKFVSWLPEARSRSRESRESPTMSVTLATGWGSVENLNARRDRAGFRGRATPTVP